ncbi:hypothetical protein EXIGLDRAFT_620572 [Exidia glandulosa HHB12029]|uniref:Exosome complex protein n=1 Tax=Exidia glandulosa HHB12029 TaxID=1314781 RepID=A0A166A0P8_EXIGL|nr:hypothetical protein EXIGLDRAFT_620572 [Exidia glandulosa HHB12029]
MDADAAKYRKVVEKLNDALDGLEESLEPLLAKPMSETLTGMTGALDQAKLNVLVPYMVHDLIFIYLKTIGVDPKTHAVVAELERIKQYFAKIKQAEDPEKRRLAIDREAAGRFIKHAIAQAKAAEQRDATAAQKQEEGMDVDGAEQAESSTGTGAKRRRPAFDPFAGVLIPIYFCT